MKIFLAPDTRHKRPTREGKKLEDEKNSIPKVQPGI